ncbi:MAG: DUF1080 domain-containing protein [Bryobacteraceae bacterium]
MHRLLLAALLAAPAFGAHWVDLLNGKDLTGWEVVGLGQWNVMKDGTLVGQYDPPKVREIKGLNQSWLYTKKEFAEFDLHVEYWTRYGGNSGVSIRDTSRGRYSWGEERDSKRTPSHIGYEIQISNHYKDKFPTGSVYLFQAAKTGSQHDDDWNSMDIEVRDQMIRVKLNGVVVAEHPGDPARSKIGPIGLQLHDANSVSMFRHLKIHEVKKAGSASSAVSTK